MKYIYLICFIFYSCCALVNTSKTSKKEDCCIERYDSLYKNNVCLYLDEMPEFNNFKETFNESILKKIDMKNVLLENYTYKISFVIDTNGLIQVPRITNKHFSDYNEFEKRLLTSIANIKGWSVGKCGNKKKPVLLNYTLKL
ncbi:MAG: hypothetical protein HY062_01855 [Bacteroidetes bacterium]|nr:hypothetical protein [Bacteroidota bacterium]